jgi:type IV pilus assembly protein PilP
MIKLRLTAPATGPASTAKNARSGAARGYASLLLPLALVALAGCGDSGMTDVQEWMDTTKRETRIAIPKIDEPKKFTPFVYGARDGVDPFSPAKLASAMAKQKATSDNPFKPDLDRRREPLEGYPLDTLKMVGTLRRANASFALLQADKTLFQVKVGNYIGQNFGRVTKIADSDVELKEIVQDASGEWVERDAKLELQENKK